MRYLLCFFLFCFPTLAHAWPAAILEVVDGDTITVAPMGQRDLGIRIRLYGIDAPEHDQPGGAESAEALRGMLPHLSRAEIIPMATDAYGRAVALVIADGKTVNADLVKKGNAWVYGRHCRAYFCRAWKADQNAARQRGDGAWKNPDPTPPWEWREKRGRSREKSMRN